MVLSNGNSRDQNGETNGEKVMYGLCSLTDHHLAENWFVVSLTSHARKIIVIEITTETGHWRKLLYLPLYLQ